MSDTIESAEQESTPPESRLFSGNVPIQAALNELRLRLLDLTGRNRLINFRHSPGKSLQFVHSTIDGTFKRLAEQNNRVTIAHLPAPDHSEWILKNGRLAKPEAKEFATNLGISTSYGLEELVGQGRQGQGVAISATDLRTLFYAEDLGKHCRKLEREAKLAVEETGANMLYLITGFLEFPEAPESEKLYLAPLLCIPVSISRTDVGQYSEFHLTYTGEEISDNLSLREKLKRDFGFNLPEYDCESDVSSEEYIKTVNEAVKNNPTWHVRHMMTLALLSFTNMLLVRDLDPVKWQKEGQFDSLLEHPVVKQVFEGRSGGGGESQYAEEYAIDEHPKSDLPLIYDADSSQHSALIDVLAGHNRVIEGPPGTGKSQTITNLIAAGLQAGKTILFVAEKLAALEVVKTRLTLAGLDPFVLELHSNKTNKKRVLEDIAKRIKHRSSGAAVLPDLLRRQEEKRRELKAYADLMNTMVGNSLNLTLHQVIWRAERHRIQAGESAAAAQEIEYFAASRTSALQFSDICDRLRYLANELKHIGTYGPDHSFWGFFPHELSPEQDLAVQRVLNEYATKFAGFSRATQDAAGLLGGNNLNMSSKGAENLLEVLANIAPASPDSVDFTALPILFSVEDSMGHASLRVLDDVQTKIAAISQHEGLVRAKLLRAGTPNEENIEQAKTATQELLIVGLGDLNHKELEATAALLESVTVESKISLDRLKGIADLAGLPFESSQSDVSTLAAVVSVSAAVKHEWLEFRHEGLRQSIAVTKLREAKAELAQIQTLHAQVDELLYLDTLHPDSVINDAVQTLREGDAWYRVFQGRWRKATGLHKRLEKSKSSKPGSARLKDLELLLKLKSAKSKWNTDPGLLAMAGVHFQADKTPLDQLLHLAQWVEVSRTALDLADVPTSAFDPLSAERATVVRLANQHDAVAVAAKAFGRLDGTAKGLLKRAQPSVLKRLEASSWEIRRETAECARNSIHLAIGFMTQYFRPDASAAAGLAALTAAQELPLMVQNLEQHSHARVLLGNKFQGRKTHLESLLGAHAYGTLVKKCGLPAAIEAIIISDQSLENCALLSKATKDINEGWQQVLDFAQKMSDFGRFDGTIWADAAEKTTTEYAQELATKTQRATGNLGGLLAWTQYTVARAEAMSLGLDGFINGLETGSIEGGTLEHAFIYRFYASIAKSVYNSVPALRQFSGTRHSSVRKDYVLLDREIIQLRGVQVADSCRRHSQPPQGNQSVRVDEKTELKLLEHLIPQQRPRVPLRQIMRRAGKAIQQLKPCFMMGPQAVAQYLEPGRLHFDIIVMDEASQLRPEQAIGAIARGSQLVVVGDPKQLPPTSFFSRMSASDGDGDAEGLGQLATTDAESILDVCISHFQPVRSLRWHYRSRHESLIAFSNQHFYRGNLVVFPSPFPKGKSLGLSYQYISDGVYENQMNSVEARRVVDAAVDHILTRSGDSLGIVTLNIKQRDLVSELLEERLRNLPQASEFKDKWEAEGMGLFIKNLENVQGDERDCIYISTTFGKAKGTNVVRQNFGPISREGGWRRLNVLFTRARKSVAVFSSMRPEDIVSDNRTPEGTRALRNYLEFARSGVMPVDHETGLPPDSDFEVAVMDVLRNNGYEVTPQLGVAGFRIDIAVKHPVHLSGYLAAVECDGASYHSGVSVRDRDRIRQEILESLGWRDRIWRIWSTDWFRNPMSETERMLQFLGNLRNQPVDQEYLIAEHGQGLAAPESLAALVPETSKSALAVENRELDFGSATAPSQEELIFDEDENDLEIKVGDLVTYAAVEIPEVEFKVKLTVRQTSPEMGLVSETTPLGSILVGAIVGETVVLRVAGVAPRSYLIKSIKRQSALES